MLSQHHQVVSVEHWEFSLQYSFFLGDNFNLHLLLVLEEGHLWREITHTDTWVGVERKWGLHVIEYQIGWAKVKL